jgi:hypothetical protein
VALGGKEKDMHTSGATATLAALLLFLALWAVAAHTEIRFKPYYRGVPDYQNTKIFQTEPATLHAEIRALVRKVKATGSCVRGQVKATVVRPHKLRTNICDTSAYAGIKALIGKLAPSLDPRRLAFSKVDLDADGEPELLVEYVDLIGDEDVKDPYLSLWLLRYDGANYRATYAGPFLVGQIWARMPFGQTKNRNMVFVRHQSCTECHPWIYVSVVDFFREPNGAAFQFRYSDDPKDFGHTIEYVLPGMGHSVDAKVETRVLPTSTEGPHLLQQFRLNEGKTEWWIFRCEDLKCDYELFIDNLPSKYRSPWRNGKKL